ncbi:MAG TPA: glycosyltransferase family 4 protein [Terriglobales bacterium]|jgi:glycosyltransferase involved in cell wall biosynthesis|nr:glycosyltransferase family 4 protein [Terriglobales bacterium]
MDTLWYSPKKRHESGRWFALAPVKNEVHPGADGTRYPSSSFTPVGISPQSRLQGKRVAMVTFSLHPFDPRPRRAAHALQKEGMIVDLFCEGEENAPKREVLNGINIWRLPVRNRRGGAFRYAYQYSAFILISSAILALRSLRRRYDLVYVHNMPDVLILSSLIPKMLGAKVILDQHDPMPELMTTIFDLDPDSLGVRSIKRLEKWSLARANLVVTVNVACKRIFANRSCSPEKIGIVMNSPNEEVFPFQVGGVHPSRNHSPTKRFVIMCHGSIVERNGLDVAIAALARVRESVPGAEFRFYGRKTAFLERIMEQVRNQGLSENVRYLGRKSHEELAREIEDCDVGIIPNPRNAFTEINTPTRIFEYLALGKPVIAPRTSGIQDYFNQESLIYFEPGSSKDLAEKLEYVASHVEEATEVAKRGQQVYLAHTWAQERQTLVNLVSELLNGGHAS